MEIQVYEKQAANKEATETLDVIGELKKFVYLDFRNSFPIGSILHIIFFLYIFKFNNDVDVIKKSNSTCPRIS